MTDSLWYKNAVFYEVYVRAFRDGSGDAHGDLRGLAEKLDYFCELGVDCIWLLPLYPSPLCDDGYDIADYYQIHPDYGTLDDFKHFLNEAHARGLRVITDLVLNHTSDQHPWFQSARRSRHSPYRDYYVWSDTGQEYPDARIIFLDTEGSNWSWDPVAGQYFWHRFYSSQPDLNYDNPAVRQEMLNVMKYWLDLGVDGFRADAVPYLFEREGTNCENLPETHDYLKEVRRYLNEHYPGRVLLAEANQWPQDVRLYFGDGDEFHMAFHFPVMPRIYMALAKTDRTPLLDILSQTPEIPANTQWCTFLRNHDELTLEMVTPEERDFMWNTFAPEPRMRLNLGIRRRLAPLLDGDQRKIELLYSILFSLPGSPILYYGDEIGMGENIWLEDRNGVRTPMQWDDSPNAGFSTAPMEALYAPLIDDERFSYRQVNVAVQRRTRGSLWNVIRKMIAVRKEQPAFGCGACQTAAADNNLTVLALIRSWSGETILTLHNLSDQPQSVQLDLSCWAGAPVADLLSDRRFPVCGDEPYPVELGAYEYLWLLIVNS
ncbi:MAG: maltose alpha-D-glucosyltransferase [Anaerolineales bacterium]|nr:maltose alpha-D-glucosyltransferase [Anaerolineales bacterium]